MDLHATDYIMYYNVHRIRFTYELFHKMYFLTYYTDESMYPTCDIQILDGILSDEERQGFDSVLHHGAFLARMGGLQHLGTKVKYAGWFKPELLPMTNDRHPYIAAAAVEPMEFEIIGSYPDLVFNPDSFRSRVKEIEALWGAVPDITRSAS